MIQLRSNGKFYTNAICAASAALAFEDLLMELRGRGVSTDVTGYTTVLRPAGVHALQFMWTRACEAGPKTVFCLFDHAGWRFFGRL